MEGAKEKESKEWWVTASDNIEHWISAIALWLFIKVRTVDSAIFDFLLYQVYVSILTDISSFSSLLPTLKGKLFVVIFIFKPHVTDMEKSVYQLKILD